jgi:hypothetical protein
MWIVKENIKEWSKFMKDLQQVGDIIRFSALKIKLDNWNIPGNSDIQP